MILPPKTPERSTQQTYPGKNSRETTDKAFYDTRASSAVLLL